MIKLFHTNDTTFTTNGIGSLIDSISCLVTEELNGEFELEMEYPITGQHYSDIALRRIIVVKSNPYSNPQPFRIYNISKPINGIVTVNAQHISYDMSGYPVAPFTATSAQTALINMKAASSVSCPFMFVTDNPNTGEIKTAIPYSMRSLVGVDIIKAYGGEYEFDGYTVNLHASRGQNRGVSIRYGKNLIDLKQEENCASVYTGVYPYYYTENNGIVQLPEKVLNAPGTYDFTRIYALDLTSAFNEKPTETDLRTLANKFMNDTNLGVPKVSIDVSFINLSQSEEYKQYASLETVKLADYVTVEFAELGVFATAKCKKAIYNVLTNRYENLELGDAISNIGTIISDGIRTAEQKLEEVKVKFTYEVDTIKIGLADINDALIDKADVNYLEANYAHIIDGYLDNAQIKNASIDRAHIAEAAIGTLQIDKEAVGTSHIQLGAITTALIEKGAVKTLQIDDGSITNAKIVTLTADKIVGNAIDTTKVAIESPNGKMRMVNNKFQVFDNINGTLVERVVLGDVNGDDSLYGLRVRGVDGTTILLDENGVTKEGITDGSIDNSKISSQADIEGSKLLDDSIVGGKLVIDAIGTREIAAEAVTANELAVNAVVAGKIDADAVDSREIKAGAVKATHVEAHSLTVDHVDSAFGKDLDLSSNESISLVVSNKVEEKMPYTVHVQSSNGTTFKNGIIDTTLTALVYKGSSLDNTIQASAINWTRVSKNPLEDIAWNNAHKGMKSIHVTKDDVAEYATFNCFIDI